MTTSTHEQSSQMAWNKLLNTEPGAGVFFVEDGEIVYAWLWCYDQEKKELGIDQTLWLPVAFHLKDVKWWKGSLVEDDEEATSVYMKVDSITVSLRFADMCELMHAFRSKVKTN